LDEFASVAPLALLPFVSVRPAEPLICVGLANEAGELTVTVYVWVEPVVLVMVKLSVIAGSL
jgi:hypothetical protein